MPRRDKAARESLALVHQPSSAVDGTNDNDTRQKRNDLHRPPPALNRFRWKFAHIARPGETSKIKRPEIVGRNATREMARLSNLISC